jgi:hypothetical protein
MSIPNWESVRQIILILTLAGTVATAAVATRIAGGADDAAIWLGEVLIVTILLIFAVVGIATADNSLATWTRLARGYLLWASQSTIRTLTTVGTLLGIAAGAWSVGPQAVYRQTVTCPTDMQLTYNTWNGEAVTADCKHSTLLKIWRPLHARSAALATILCRDGAFPPFPPQPTANDELLCAPPQPKPAAALSGQSIPDLWPNNTVLDVRFMDGDLRLIARVKRYITEWERYANIHFRFVGADDAEVRVSFKPRSYSVTPSYAFVGTKALGEPVEVPTVVLGQLSASSSDDEVAAVVLHEFGHVLGLLSEQSNPNATITWNTSLLVREPASFRNGVPSEDPYPKVAATEYPGYRPFDPSSVMMEPFPPRWAFNKFSGERNIKLSDSDKAFIAKLYPR